VYSIPFSGTLLVAVHCTARKDGVPVGHDCIEWQENVNYVWLHDVAAHMNNIMVGQIKKSVARIFQRELKHGSGL